MSKAWKYFFFHKVLPARRIPTIMYWGIQQLVYDNGILKNIKKYSLYQIVNSISTRKMIVILTC